MASPLAGKKRIAILFDVSGPPPEDHDYSAILDEDSWRSECSVARSLKNLGHEVFFLGVFDDTFRLVSDLQRMDPDLIFNMTEAFQNDREFEPQIASLLDLLGIPYTGTKMLGLGLCKDKSLCKKILSHHGILVPKWLVSKTDRPLRKIRSLQYPAFVKLIHEEGSEGISLNSFVENEKDALERVSFLHERYSSDVMIEEYVPGREFYVSILGNRRLQILPIRELKWKDFPEDAPRFATYKTKWDEDYRKRWGIRNEFARGLTEEQLAEIKCIASEAFEALHLSSHARLDMRLSDNGKIYVLEVNPNPSLAEDDDFALSAMKSGLKYDQVIDKILDLAAT